MLTWIEELLGGSNAVPDRLISQLNAVHGDDWGILVLRSVFCARSCECVMCMCIDCPHVKARKWEVGGGMFHFGESIYASRVADARARSGASGIKSLHPPD